MIFSFLFSPPPSVRVNVRLWVEGAVNVPQLERAILRARDHQQVVLGERDAAHNVVVAAQGGAQLPLLGGQLFVHAVALCDDGGGGGE